MRRRYLATPARPQRRSGWLALFLLAWPVLAAAQVVPDTLWTRTFGGTNIDVGYSVRQTADGGFIVSGYTRSFGTMSGRNVLLLKVAATGEVAWHNEFGGNDDDEGCAVRQVADGGYVVAGHTKSFGAGGKDVLLIKTDESGNLDWLRTYGGTSDDEGYAVCEVDSGYVIAGVTSSYGAGSRDVWLIKTDRAGNVIWSRTHGGLSSDGAWSIAPTTDGGFAIAGWTFSYGPGAVGNAWLVKTDAQGIQQWQRAFGGTGVDRAYAVQQTSDGGYVLAGYTDSFGAGLYDMLLIKTYASGDQQWMQTFGGAGRDYAQAVEQTIDGGYIVAGYTLSFGAGSEDVWLVKTGADGSEQWSQTYGGTSSDEAFSVEQTSDHGTIVTGHTLSYGAGLHDVWLIRLEGAGPTAVGTGAMPARPQLRPCYPNPFNPRTSIGFSLPSADHVTLAIFDARGREVARLLDDTVRAGVNAVDWTGIDDAGRSLPSGTYFCRLETASGVQTRKMSLIR